MDLTHSETSKKKVYQQTASPLSTTSPVVAAPQVSPTRSASASPSALSPKHTTASHKPASLSPQQSVAYRPLSSSTAASSTAVAAPLSHSQIPARQAPAPGAPTVVGGLADAVSALPAGAVFLEKNIPSNDPSVVLFDQIVRVEGKRYPAVRRIIERSLAGPDAEPIIIKEMVADQILVNLAPGITIENLSAATGVPFTLRRFLPGTGTAVLAFEVAEPSTVDAVQKAVEAQKEMIQFSEPDYIVRILNTPNDPKYTNGSLWGMHNTGQNSGTADADVDAPEGWGVRTSAISNAITQSRASRSAYGFGANDLVIAVVDTGVRYTHEDIAANMWVNSGEIPGNGIDDDNNGVIDDVYGVNAVADNGDPMDDNMHGTHCAGTIAGVGNNGLGVAGIAWNAKIVACKFLDAEGSGANSDASEALWYAWEQAGADIISCSWGGGVESSEVTNQIRAAGLNGAIVVAAAGNDAKDLEETATYPAASQAPNIVTVSASTRTDAMSSFTNYNYGWSNVFAPGTDIESLGINSDSHYTSLSGTSMATPLVAGVLALLRAEHPTESYGQIINRLQRSVDKKSTFNKKCLTGGRVNYDLAIRSTDNTPFNDNFADASEMLGSAGHSVRTTNFSATAESGEPSHAGVMPNRTLWFKWTAPATKNYILSTKGSSYGSVIVGTGGANDTYNNHSLDTAIGIYTGGAVNALTEVASNDDYLDSSNVMRPWSRIAFAATSGTTYFFAVGTKSSAAPNDEGMIILSITEPPANDLFADAFTVGSIPYSTDKTNSGALTELNEPKLTRADVTDTAWLPADAPAHIRTAVADAYPDKRGGTEDGGASVWWKWTPSTTAEYTVSTEGSYVDTLLGIYTASTPGGATFAERGVSLVAQSDDIGLVRMGNEWIYMTASRVRQTFTAGVTYYIQIDTINAKEGSITLSVSQPPANDHIANATVMSGNLWSATVNNIGASMEQGEPKHYDKYGAVSVWYKWTAPSTQDYQVSMSVTTIPVTYVVYTAANPSAPDVNQITALAGTSGITGSGFRFSATAGETYFFVVDGIDGKQRSDMQLDVSPTPGAILNDHFAERIRIYGTSARVSSDTASASFESGEPEKFNTYTQRSVWWTWTAPASGSVTFTTQYSGYNASLGVYTGSALGGLTEIAYHQPSNGFGSSEFGTVTFSATRGVTYQICVFGSAEYCGTVTLNLSMSLANALPQVTSASLSKAELFSDEPLSVSLVQTSDAESDPVTVAYQWQSSTDAKVWAAISGATAATLPATDALAGYFVRCELIPSDATGDGNAFYTGTAAVKRRPLQIARHGQAFTHTPALPIEGALPEIKRKAILNEFCKGAGNTTTTGALNGEWYEILVLQDLNMTGYFFGNVFRSIRFLDIPLWQNVPKGTIIVIYNPTNKSPLLPADDASHTDGNRRIIVSGSDATYFDNGSGFAPTCPKLSGSADTGSNELNTGARITLNRAFTGGIDDISYISTDHLGSDGQFKKTPHLQAWLGGGQTYRYTRDNEDFCESSSNWELGNADANFATPGEPNNLDQAAWINKLRAPAPQYRFAGSSITPNGLSIDPATGTISGTINEPSGGLFRIVIERFATGSATVNQTFDLLVGTADRTFRIGSGQSFSLQGDLDLGTATLVNNGGTITDNGYAFSQKQSYATWAAAHGVSGAAGDLLDSLAVSNQMAFALNLDPATALPSDLPALALANLSGSDYLTLTFRRQKGNPRVTYTVEACSDLTSWSPVNISTHMVGTPTPLDHATEEVTVRDSQAFGGSTTRRFLRLKVSDNLAVPAAPASSSATVEIGQVGLSWSGVSGADSYTVKRSTTSGGPYTTIAAGLTSLAYADTTAATGTTYYYIVTAISLDDGESTATLEMAVTTPASWAPSAPTNLAATADAAQVSLSWDPAQLATTYTVRRSTTSGSGYADLATGLTGTTYNDTTGNHAQTYYYVVLAVNSQGTSPASNEISSATSAYAWAADGNGNWTTTSNWNESTYPNGVGRFVNFGSVITSARTVTLDANATVGSISFNEDSVTANAYSVNFNSGTSLTFDVASGNAAINARGTGGYGIGTQGNGTIQLADTLAISAGSSGAATADGSTIAINSQITGTGGLVLSSLNSNDGTGTAITGSRGTYLRSTIANTFSGGVVVNSGYLGISGHIGNLGSGTLTLNASDSSNGGIGTGLALRAGGGTLTTPIVFGNPGATGGSSPRLQINLGDSAQQSYSFTGGISGDLGNQTLRFQTLSSSSTNTASSVTLSGDSSALMIGTSATVFIRTGSISLNHAHAFGTNNTVGNGTSGGWQLGNFSNGASGTTQLLTNGYNVGGRITTNQTTTSGQTSNDTLVLGGTHTSSSASFSGNIILGRIVGGTRKLQLTSAAGGITAFSGTISDGSISGSASTVVPVEIAGAGIVQLNNASNSYTGLTTIASGATLGGTGRTGGALTVADGGKLAFIISTNAASHDKFEVNGALAFSGASTLTITQSGTPATGTYTLITASGGISGTLPSLSLPSGWSATLQTSGNDLQLVVTALP